MQAALRPSKLWASFSDNWRVRNCFITWYRRVSDFGLGINLFTLNFILYWDILTNQTVAQLCGVLAGMAVNFFASNIMSLANGARKKLLFDCEYLDLTVAFLNSVLRVDLATQFPIKLKILFNAFLKKNLALPGLAFVLNQ